MADDPPRDVLSGLPRSRPVRRSPKRAGSSDRPADAAGAPPAPAPERRRATTRAAAADERTAAAGRRAATPAAQDTATGRPPVPPAGWATPSEAAGATLAGVELVTTVVRAVGELAQIGVAVGSEAVRQLLGRLPRP
jgi:hypothetical protein